MKLRAIVSIVTLLLVASQSACAADRTFQGKVIDAETFDPIQGALVLANWNKTRFGGLMNDTRFKDAKETLTDENGDWAIIGPEGNHSKIRSFLQYLGIFRTMDPTFDIYKPGYTEFEALGNFSAWVCTNKEHNLEGIILMRPGDTKEKRKKFFKKFGLEEPFIAIENPEKKLRNLKFVFDYPSNVRTLSHIWCRENKIKAYWVYTVIGLRKAKTREERIKAMNNLPSDERLPLALKMGRAERERLFGLDRRNQK